MMIKQGFCHFQWQAWDTMRKLCNEIIAQT